MPSALSNQNNYYATHHRRQSSLSQNNLPDFVRSPTQLQSSSQSQVFLPSTAYSQPSTTAPRPRSPSLTASSSQVRLDLPVDEPLSHDPHEFYRQYRDPFSNPASLALHQEGIRATTSREDDDQLHISRELSNTSVQSSGEHGLRQARDPTAVRKVSLHTINGAYEGAQPKSSGSVPNNPRSRKASFKDLVARFDASPEDLPPLPTQQFSRPGSRTASPKPFASGEHAQLDGGPTHPRRPSTRPSDAYRRTGAAVFNTDSVLAKDPLTSRNRLPATELSAKVPGSVDVSQPARKLLFGEILPTVVNASPGVGYGILRRRGSEGSPLHTPNAIFPSSNANFSTQDDLIYDVLTIAHRSTSPALVQTSQQPVPRPTHRRAHSDFVHSASKGPPGPDPLSPVDIEFMARTLHYMEHPEPKQEPQSRIPVMKRHHRMASEPAATSPSARSSHGSQLPLRVADHNSPSLLLPQTQRKPQSPRRRPKSPIQIKSPGRRAKDPMSQGSKSPSLRANIIAPPPKISPPLRSSRPRLPVSAATTTASRLKMAEKFQASAKEQSDRKLSRRQRPPELSDIDLKARRLKITQALSRSREGDDLRVGSEAGVQSPIISRTTSIVLSAGESDADSESAKRSGEVPAVVVEPAADADAGATDERAFYASVEPHSSDQRAFTQNAVKIVHDHSPEGGYGVDSPTLGHPENGFGSISLSLNTHLLPRQDEHEPQSAQTVATEATIIDAEPQTDATRLQTPSQSLLSQISVLRNQSSYSPLSAHSQTSGEASNDADAVSVQLMMRDTTYLDDDEAAEKGYRPFPPSAGSDLDPSRSNERSSWSSSIEDPVESEKGGVDMAQVNLTPDYPGFSIRDVPASMASSINSSDDDDQCDSAPRDAYTIVNIVLQKQTPSGVVDQQLVDDIYHRIIRGSPDLAEADNVDEERVEQLCLQELENYSDHWGEQDDSPPEPAQDLHPETLSDSHQVEPYETSAHSATHSQNHAPPLPPNSFRGHRYKSSLDSAEDWAETSPSVVDWMRFALTSPKELERKTEGSSDLVGTQSQEPPPLEDARDESSADQVRPYAYADSPTVGLDATIIPPLPSHSPPAPPTGILPANDMSSWSAPVGIRPPNAQTPKRARPLTAASQLSARSSLDHQMTPSSSSVTRPSDESEITPEQRRLKQRRHVIKEIVDTEYTYERDMRVLCDIYRQTAIVAISDEDIKLIFGNVDLVQQFAKEFLGFLRQVAAPSYVMERSDRKKDGNRNSSVQGPGAADEYSSLTEVQRDQLTRVGHAFEVSMVEMERTYTDYIRTRHAANKRMEVLQSAPAVVEWLRECSENSSDITNAWSLDALLVKPIQRITKYPLLLHQLLEATPSDHPDVEFVRKACAEMTEVNMRINDVKKHTEIVDQVLNRKRKESDVRNGLTKAFGRRAEKLRQHVGMNEMFEDEEFTRIKRNYDNNIAHLYLVTKDVRDSVEVISTWVTGMCGLANVAEAWVDVGHTNYPQAESKLRQLAIVVRGIHSIALPDHVEQMTRRVIQPMESTATMLAKFKGDPKGLIQKREKRLLDYNQFKNKRDRGEKLDKKMIERMEQWEALNIEAKARMSRLQEATGRLVRGCQITVMNLHQDWLNMCNQKFSAAMGIDVSRLEFPDIIKDWQEEFDPQHAFAMSLSICNGTLLTEAVNLLTFLTPGSTLTGEDSPRQASLSSGMKRSVSTNDETVQAVVADRHHRHSEGPQGSHIYHSDGRADHHTFSYGSSRMGLSSAGSGIPPRTPESMNRGTAASMHRTSSRNASRPSTSSRPSEEVTLSTLSAPRVSLEAPSPTIGELLTDPNAVAAKHSSGSTFYSASAGVSQSQSGAGTSTNRGSIFSSAMPMGETGGEEGEGAGRREAGKELGVLFTAASVYEFNIDRSRQQGGFRYLTYVAGEIFDVIAEHGELWLAINQDDESREVGWIWNKHFAKLAT
ncbi:hypothetical protein B0A52_03068 [Exophiala mesophila]|uniref:Dynamin-binding protein n=1 Tax=Exophiala mesophila TaxID=212818 RepID=A0A438NCE4_EXOME|nr:hypothetical protein B0A52_03068 [Exophiala mesophila]